MSISKFEKTILREEFGERSFKIIQKYNYDNDIREILEALESLK